MSEEMKKMPVIEKENFLEVVPQFVYDEASKHLKKLDENIKSKMNEAYFHDLNQIIIEKTADKVELEKVMKEIFVSDEHTFNWFSEDIPASEAFELLKAKLNESDFQSSLSILKEFVQRYC